MRGTYLWLVQLFSGAAIAVFLGIHMVVQHFGADKTGWGEMITRSREGGWVFVYVALLAFGLYHGINGLRGIILESTSSVAVDRAVTWFLVIFGIAVFIWGTYVPVALAAG